MGLTIFCIWAILIVGKLILSLCDEGMESVTKSDIKEDYEKISLNILNSVDVEYELKNNKEKLKEAMQLVGRQMGEIYPEYGEDGSKYQYDKPGYVDFLSCPGIQDLYFVWLYLSKKGKIHYKCGSYSSVDFGYSFRFPANGENFPENVAKYIKVMRLVEKNIQEHYPNQRLFYVTKDNGEGFLNWEATISWKELNNKSITQRLW